MIETPMMSTLLSIPLFQGLTMDELLRLLEQVKPDFPHYEDGDYIVRQGERHRQLLYVLSGTVVREHAVQSGSLRFTERLAAGHFIELTSLFGRDASLRASYRAEGDVALLAFDKEYMFNVFGRFSIVQLNLLNLICAQSQSAIDRLTAPLRGEGIMPQFCRFVTNLCESTWGEKQLDVTRVELARLLGCNSRRLSDEMAGWEARGLITIAYGRIIIPDMKRLMYDALTRN